MPHREAILDPTGQSERARAATLTPRVHDLAGIRLGLLENGKPRWRLSSEHPDAVPDSAAEHGEVRVLGSEQAVQIVVVGAHNAGVSAVIETFGPRGSPPAIVPIGSA